MSSRPSHTYLIRIVHTTFKTPHSKLTGMDFDCDGATPRDAVRCYRESADWERRAGSPGVTPTSRSQSRGGARGLRRLTALVSNTWQGRDFIPNAGNKNAPRSFASGRVQQRHCASNVQRRLGGEY